MSMETDHGPDQEPEKYSFLQEKIKDEAGLSSRCMPFEQEELSNVCVCCGKKAKTMVYWGKAY